MLYEKNIIFEKLSKKIPDGKRVKSLGNMFRKYFKIFKKTSQVGQFSFNILNLHGLHKYFVYTKLKIFIHGLRTQNHQTYIYITDLYYLEIYIFCFLQFVEYY